MSTTPKERLYFKIYQDKTEMDVSFTCNKKALDIMIDTWEEEARECDDFLCPVIEPILMTKEEFEGLEEFKGY